jgi:translation elongation factor EF-1beta
MKMLITAVAFGLVTFVAIAAVSPSESGRTDDLTEWIAKSLKEMESVKVGMRRTSEGVQRRRR